MSYKLVTYDAGQGPRAGLVVGDDVLDAATATGRAEDATMLGLLQDWANAKGRLDKAAKGDRSGARKLSAVKLLAPISNPGGIYCAGANYSDHVLEMAKWQNIAPEPDPHEHGLKAWHFIKPAGTITNPGETVELPKASKAVDWEVELVAVIGKTAKNVSVDKALDHVAGYTIANDLSARDLFKRPPVPAGSPFHYDWLGQKCFDQSCPLGPWIVPADAIGDPQSLALSLAVNGEVQQDSNTSQMIFSTAEQIAHLSEKLTLRPGDLVLTGTPAGVGTPRGVFLKPGDDVVLTIEKIGELRNRMA